jgi:hypothetical protein
VFVAGDHQRAETEAASAFDNLGRAVDKNDFLAQFRSALGILRGIGTVGRTTGAAGASAGAAVASGRSTKTSGWFRHSFISQG